MGSPVRLQRLRTKGFDLQAESRAINGLPAVYVGRPTKWGNPFILLNEEGFPLIEGPGVCEGTNLDWAIAPQRIVDLFRERAVDNLPDLAPLAGKNLACWCPLTCDDGTPHPCHADILLELANPAGKGEGR